LAMNPRSFCRRKFASDWVTPKGQGGWGIRTERMILWMLLIFFDSSTHG
jgi:hypothetical protein